MELNGLVSYSDKYGPPLIEGRGVGSWACSISQDWVEVKKCLGGQ